MSLGSAHDPTAGNQSQAYASAEGQVRDFHMFRNIGKLEGMSGFSGFRIESCDPEEDSTIYHDGNI